MTGKLALRCLRMGHRSIVFVLGVAYGGLSGRIMRPCIANVDMFIAKSATKLEIAASARLNNKLSRFRLKFVEI